MSTKHQSKQLEGYKKLIQNLKHSEVRLRRTKSRKGKRAFKFRQPQHLIEQVADVDQVQRLIFPRPQKFEHVQLLAEREPRRSPAPAAVSPLFSSSSSPNRSNRSHSVAPVRAVFHTLADDPYTKKDDHEYAQADKTIRTQRERQEQQQQLNRRRPQSAKETPPVPVPPVPLPRQDTTKRTTTRRPHSAAPRTSRPAPPPAPAAPSAPPSTHRAHRPSTANGRMTGRTTRTTRTTRSTRDGVARSTSTRPRPQSASAASVQRARRGHQRSARQAVEENDHLFRHRLDKQHLSRHVFQTVRRQVYANHRGNAAAAASLVHTSQSHSNHSAMTSKRQLHAKRLQTLSSYHTRVQDTHLIFAQVLDDLKTSR